jgi:hypothetical protein
MNWSQLRHSRDFHAAWIGAVLLALAIWFDVVWIGLLIVVMAGAAVLFGDWLVSVWTRPERDRRDQD